jgi:Fe-S-cluster-containing dehydrogenase component
MNSLSGKLFLIDIDSCVRCHACEIACRQEHDLSVETGSCWCRVITVGPRRLEGKLHMDFVPLACFHCDEPACAAACPNSAISKSDDGLVLVDEKACNGCKLCLHACLYGCMSFHTVKHVAGHCDLCRERVEFGIEPACVQHCIGGALQFVTTEELRQNTSGQHTFLFGKVCYVSSKWRLQGLL